MLTLLTTERLDQMRMCDWWFRRELVVDYEDLWLCWKWCWNIWCWCCWSYSNVPVKLKEKVGARRGRTNIAREFLALCALFQYLVWLVLKSDTPGDGWSEEENVAVDGVRLLSSVKAQRTRTREPVSFDQNNRKREKKTQMQSFTSSRVQPETDGEEGSLRHGGLPYRVCRLGLSSRSVVNSWERRSELDTVSHQ
jgi:hypothetical protein